MYDTLTTKNFEDFKQRYSGCFGWLTQENKEVLVHITSVKPDQVQFSTSSDSDFFAFANQNVIFKFLPIKRGWYNTRYGAVLLSRIPARQYQRGISSNNTSCMYFRFGSIGFSLGTRGLTTQLLEDVFKETKEPVTFTDQTSILSPFFTFAPKDQAKSEQDLYFLDARIGVYTDKTKKIKLKNEWLHVKQEVLDTISRVGLSSKLDVE
jgi:hypothetical protein